MPCKRNRQARDLLVEFEEKERSVFVSVEVRVFG